MRFRPSLPLIFAAITLIGCSEQADDEAGPSPSPTLTSQALPTEAPDGTPLASGEWLIEEAAGGASAAFREQGGTNALVLVCDRANRKVSLSRAGSATAPQRFRIAVAEQEADVMLAPGGTAGLSAAVDQAQPIFAAFADPASVIEVTGPVAPPLRIPGHPGISRVFAACG